MNLDTHKILYDIALKNLSDLLAKETAILNNFLNDHTISTLPDGSYRMGGRELSVEEFDEMYQKYRKIYKL